LIFWILRAGARVLDGSELKSANKFHGFLNSTANDISVT